jgi:hypothetical protein
MNGGLMDGDKGFLDENVPNDGIPSMTKRETDKSGV